MRNLCHLLYALCGEDVVAVELHGGGAVEVHGPVERLQEGEDHREGDLGGVVDLPQVLRRVLGEPVTCEVRIGFRAPRKVSIAVTC